MEYMKTKGIRRAYLELGSIWKHGKPERIRVVARTYFTEYDGPHSQLRDPQPDPTGRLDSIAIDRSRKFPLSHGVDRPVASLPEGQHVCSSVELFDDPRFPQTTRPWYPCGEFGQNPLADASSIGDADGVARLLADRKFSQEQLNDALLHAVKNYYDNSDVIELLAKAGADINYRDPRYGMTVLMWALDRPIQVPKLISLGADVNAKGPNGDTPLTIARRQGLGETVGILEQAGAAE